jgi:hypothetical protein
LVSLGASTLIVDLSTLAVTATAIDATAAMASLDLWDERNTPRRSSVDLTFSAPALAVYVSASGPNPAEMLVLASVSAVAHLDRPVAADGGRIAMQSDQATVAFVELGSGTTVFVLAPISISATGPEPAPIALVLRNLFMKTTAPLGFFIFGKAAISGLDIARRRWRRADRFPASAVDPDVARSVRGQFRLCGNRRQDWRQGRRRGDTYTRSRSRCELAPAG